ncbi:putative hydro-lyase [Pseudomonas oryzihabitans]|uniref:putative hydro-lyase n=1 Tax=Pseudomonas oryzihabitans TaxID=47885 RepID=UPI0028954534|nr:putative hydro-lyase [Pseudomonas oryzihabitans]MDT3722716.1 putative hydro-lyase [Pseudomonas oryzihabitans]
MNPLQAAQNAAIDAAREARARYRDGLVAPSAGVAPGMTQANLIALPRDWAYDFLLYAQRNPQACPVLDVTDAGSYRTPLAEGADLRTDLPLYRVWRDGMLVEEVADGRAAWAEHPDLVTFLIGCSFTFETGLLEAGIEIRHITDGSNVPMYRTNRACRPAGRLHGEMVVSMRPIPAERVAEAATITARYPAVHGAPVHIGEPARLGIADLARPDFGDAVRIEPGEIPVFWGCGVTPQAAVMASKVPFAITHAPGHMFITDVPDRTYHL